MHSNRIITFIIILLIGGAWMLPSCTNFIADVDLQDDWQVKESGKIRLYYRAGGFSGKPSPGDELAEKIVENQNIYYRAILDTLKRSFNDKILIYLYNEDEAEELIGTNTGGHAIPKYNCFYYTYLSGLPSLEDRYGVDNRVIGAHELAHVITHRILGYPGTKLMSEGYAVWLDGTYGGCPIEDIIRKYRDKEPEKIMSPDALLNEQVDKEAVYYPNAGVLLGYWAHAYGIAPINLIFSSRRETLKDDFRKVTGVDWQEMSAQYEQYLNEL